MEIISDGFLDRISDGALHCNLLRGDINITDNEVLGIGPPHPFFNNVFDPETKVIKLAQEAGVLSIRNGLT